MNFPLEDRMREMLKEHLLDLEKKLNSDILYYNGEISHSLVLIFKKVIEELTESTDSDDSRRNTLSIILTTPGGDIESVERLVSIVRKHYSIVNFIIPDIAMSAGTIFALSGDDIFMSYSSALGPIDPQTTNAKGEYVPVRGYLDKVREFVQKSDENTLTNAEFAMLRELDLAKISKYEKICDLATEFLKEWLSKYKFKNWSKKVRGEETITQEVKKQRAKEIADKLGDNSLWLTHGRYINIQRLSELGLKIIDFSGEKWYKDIENYYQMITSYHNNINPNIPWSLHTRTFII